MEFLERVRVWNGKFTACQILEQHLRNVSDFAFTNYQRATKRFSTNRILINHVRYYFSKTNTWGFLSSKTRTQIWVEIAELKSLGLVTWTQIPIQIWEPKLLKLRRFTQLWNCVLNLKFLVQERVLRNKNAHKRFRNCSNKFWKWFEVISSNVRFYFNPSTCIFEIVFRNTTTNT